MSMITNIVHLCKMEFLAIDFSIVNIKKWTSHDMVQQNDRNKN